MASIYYGKICKLLLLISIIIQLNGCDLLKTKVQSNLIEQASMLTGMVEVNNAAKTPVYVQLHKIDAIKIAVQKQILLTENKTYTFYISTGRYMLFAYQDENRDQVFSSGETGEYLRNKLQLPVEISITHKQEVKLPVLRMDQNSYFPTTSLALDTNVNSANNIGKVVSIDDPTFDLENAKLGLWQPLDFIDKVGAGLFMLDEYDPKKTPVLFVHGIKGSPIQFKALISSIDRSKFQIWLAYYPSGVRLDMISNALAAALDQLKLKYDFKDIHLVSHSMGGLISRSFLMKHQRNKASYTISKFMTINSPLLGLKTAQAGVEYSPVIIPAWRDLAANSDFINKVNAWNLPASTKYSLIFSYLAGEEGDGVIPLSSQLSVSLQKEAISLLGVEAEHTDTLSDPEFIKHFVNFIDDKS